MINNIRNADHYSIKDYAIPEKKEIIRNILKRRIFKTDANLLRCQNVEFSEKTKTPIHLRLHNPQLQC